MRAKRRMRSRATGRLPGASRTSSPSSCRAIPSAARRLPISPVLPGSRSARRSADGEPERTTELYVVDTIGELGLFYRLAPLVFMGGSLVPHGGQNPIEPAKLGAAILHGPHVHNFTDVYAALDGAGGALPVADGQNLTYALYELFSDPGVMRDMARAAAGAVEGLGGALGRTVQAIEPFIAQMKLEEY